MALTKILPETGRGTIRRMVEGALPTTQGRARRPAPTVSRFAPATSPFRGGSSTPQTTPVTLNSFVRARLRLQGPSLGTRRSVVQGANRAAVLSTWAPGFAVRWMLKRVQHDEVLWEAVYV